jgi:hypothetical protein
MDARLERESCRLRCCRERTATVVEEDDYAWLSRTGAGVTIVIVCGLLRSTRKQENGNKTRNETENENGWTQPGIAELHTMIVRHCV